jgi:GT2 family glycosyltransferase
MAPAPDQDGLTVSAIVVGYNHERTLPACMESLATQEGLSRLEVIYVDNASADGSLAVVERYPRVRIIRNRENLGFALAVNQALEQVRCRLTVLVNPDVILASRVLLRLGSALGRPGGPAMVAPTLRAPRGGVRDPWAPFPSVCGLLRDRVGLAPRRAPRWIIGAVVMMESRQLRRLGGLEELYFTYGEDMELCHQLLSRGMTIEVLPEVEAVHLGNPRWSPDRLVRVYGAYMRFARRHRPAERLPLGILLSLRWLLRGGAARQPLPALAEGLTRIWSPRRDRRPEERP